MPRDAFFTPPLVSAPSLPVIHVQRPHLITRLLDSLQVSPILLLRAPAGYGKTTLLVELQHNIHIPTLYLSLKASELDAASILGWLVNHYQQSYPEAVEAVRRVYASTRRFDLAYRVLLQALASNNDACLVILDDYPVKRIAGIENIEYLVNHRPPGWRIAISSRGKPDLPWARWAASGDVTELTDTDIRYTPYETSRLVSDVLGYSLTPDDETLLEADYQGWPLGLKLMAYTLRDFSPDECSRILKVLHRERGLILDINDYLEYDIYQSCVSSESEQAFLLYTSVLDKLTASICNDLLGIENAGEMLRSLHRRGVFLHGQDPAGKVYTYHPIFGAFLQQLLHHRHGAAAVLVQHQRAAQVYEQNAEWATAINHYLAAQAYEEVCRLILTHSAALLTYTNGHTNGSAYLGLPGAPGIEAPTARMLRWLHSLPLQIIEQQPQLLQLRHQLEQADQRGLSSINGVLAIRAPASAPADSRAAVRRARVYFAQGKYEAAIQCLRQSLPTTAHEPAQRAEVLLGLSINLGALVQPREAIEAGEEGLLMLADVVERTHQLDLEMRMTRQLAYLYRDVGELDIALAMSERSLDISALEGIGDQHSRQQSLRARMLMLVARGDFEAARHLECAWQSLSETPSASPSISRAYALLNARMALVEQDYAAAERWLSMAVDIGSDFTHLRLVQGDYDEALRLAQAELATQQAHSNILGRWIAQTWLGIVQAHAGDHMSAGPLLDSAIDFFRQRGLTFWLAGAQLHRAWLRQTDDPAAAHQDLAEALTYGMRVSAFNFPFWHPDVVAFACTEAFRIQQYSPYVHDLAVRRLTPAQTRPLRRWLNQSSVSTPASPPRPLSADEPATQGTPSHTDNLLSRTLHPSLEYLFDEGRLTRGRAVTLMTRYHLTHREIEILALYLDPDVRGSWRRVNEAIAQKLALSEVTVRDKISVILKKLEAPGRDRLKLRAWAIQEGIVPA